MTERMIWVSLPRATFGIVICGGRVVDGAPYARGRGLRLVGVDERQAAAKLRVMGAKLVPLPHIARHDVVNPVQSAANERRP